MCVSIEGVKGTVDIEDTFTSSDDVVKSMPTQTTPPAGEHSYTATSQSTVVLCIRASVDALCRDGAGLISRERVQRGRLTRQRTTS